MGEPPPPPKRPKIDEDEDEDDDDDGTTGMEEIVDTVWKHYRNFLDSLDGGEEDDEEDDEEGGDNDGDIDEIQELIEISKSHTSKPDPDTCTSSSAWKSRTELLPILLSVGYHHLADRAIAQYLMMQQQQQQFSTSDIDTAVENAQNLVVESLEWYPGNASTWSMGANFGRMSQSLSLLSTRKWYEKAVETSTMLRHQTLQALEDDSVPEDVKEWIELLILNEIVGTQYEDNEEEEDDDDDENEINKDEVKNNENDIDKEDEDDSPGRYSSSAVESTARFMCAMLWSMEGRHDRSLDHLRGFQFTHRLHPNVWKIGKTPPHATQVADIEHPLAFQPPGGILPSHLYDAITKLFAPDAAYWIESDYATRGYYSFFHEYDSANAEQQPCNLLEEIIINHLLPRAQQCLVNMTETNIIINNNNNSYEKSDPSDSTTICGFEWWTHTRPIQANLGHNLHFDTDESMLDQEGKLTHPVLSSVLYLTGGEKDDLSDSQVKESPAGATIILDQTPDSETVGETCWQGIPKDNTLLLFPGNLLHGVLPCPGDRNQEIKYNPEEKKSAKIDTLIHDLKNGKRNNSVASPSSCTGHPPHRLTFMVGFWTRNVPAAMKQRNIYGPCGPLPPPTEKNTWVHETMDGYNKHEATDKDTTERIVAEKFMSPTILPSVSPAWECIQSKKGDNQNEDENESENENDPDLIIPQGVDHRYFVRDAPHCFRRSLFEERESNH
ncbi:MAG: hypothetical protein ACI8RD_003680 [Bacillariaceae sp.]|jgi:hypothetical protein